MCKTLQECIAPCDLGALTHTWDRFATICEVECTTEHRHQTPCVLVPVFGIEVTGYGGMCRAQPHKILSLRVQLRPCRARVYP